MAYNFVAVGNQNLRIGSSILTAAPITIAGWTKPTSSAARIILGIFDSLGNNAFYAALNSSSEAVCEIGAQGNYSSSVVGTVNFNSQNHVSAVFATATSRTGYLDGVAGVENTDSRTPTSGNLNQVRIGSWATGNSVLMNGDISETAIWNVALTAAEITSLSKGFKPYRIRPQSLVFYAPLIRNLQDTKGALAITNNNTATVAVHPRVY